MKSLASLSSKSMAEFISKPILRTACTSCVAAAVMILAGGSTASAQSAPVFRAIRIDMSAIPAGARQTRDDIQVCLSLGLPKAFAGRINPAAQGAPLLVVRPTSIWLASLTSHSTADDTGGSDTSSGFDSMEGEAIVGNRRIPLTVTASAPSGSAALPVEIARMRAITLCNSFVGWLARKI
jgi:hypothetical protein